MCLKWLALSLALGLLLLASTLAALASEHSLSGRTWVCYHGTFTRWSGVDVELQQGGAVVSSTVSGEGGEYAFSGISEGVYDLVAETRVGCSCYRGVRWGVVVSGTVRANVLLYKYGRCCRAWLPVIVKGW